MPRELRPRKARQSYTALFDGEEKYEYEPGPSQLPPHPDSNDADRDKNGPVDDDDSTSEFTPPVPGDAPMLSDENGSEHGVEDPTSLGDGGVGAGAESGSDDNSPILRGTKKKQVKKKGAGQGKGKDATRAKAKTKGKGKDRQKEKGKEKKEKEKAMPNLKSPGPATTTRRSIVASTARQNYALPNPNIHHRHRPVPLFRGPTARAAASTDAAVRVERLLHAPLLFAPNETAPTNAYASASLLTSRVGKAWGASVGAGPVWQIVEDLGWFREAEKQAVSALPEVPAQGQVQVQVYDERMRRPRVHVDVRTPLSHDGRSPVILSVECVSHPFFLVSSVVSPSFNVVVVRDGIAYMPMEGSAATAAAPPVSCDFGPFGDQTNVNLETLEALKICKLALPLSSVSGAPKTQNALILSRFVTSF